MSRTISPSSTSTATDSTIQKVRGVSSTAGLLTPTSGAATISRAGPLITEGDSSATS
jgi:hypothetical protein